MLKALRGSIVLSMWMPVHQIRVARHSIGLAGLLEHQATSECNVDSSNRCVFKDQNQKTKHDTTIHDVSIHYCWLLIITINPYYCSNEAQLLTIFIDANKPIKQKQHQAPLPPCCSNGMQGLIGLHLRSDNSCVFHMEPCFALSISLALTVAIDVKW